MSSSLALSILGGGTASTGSAADPSAALLAFRRASAAGAEAKGVARLAEDAASKQALARFAEGISRARDVKAALSDPRVTAVLLPALGLAEASAMPGLVTRALMSDPSDRNSVASRLAATNPQWRQAAATLRLATRGMDGLRDAAVQKSLADGYLAYQWRVSQDKEAAGVSDALYFRQRLATGKPLTAFEVLGDKSLRRVVTGALGLPKQIAIQPVETQARAITSRLDLAALNDPRQATRLLERYVMSGAGSAPAGNAGPTSLLSLFA